MWIPFKEKFDEVFRGEAKWYKKYPWFLLFLVIFVVSAVPEAFKDGFNIPKEKLLSSIGVVLFLVSGLFALMLMSDKIKKIKRWSLQALASMGMAAVCVAWLITTIMWLLSVIEP